MKKASRKVYQFKVTLKGIRPPIWRRIQVPESYTFWDLHVAIQDAMGWTDSHLHTFEMVNPKTGFREEIGIPDEDIGSGDDRTVAGWERKISKYFTPSNSKALYLYDFGDDWTHEVKLEKALPGDKEVFYPLCLAGKRACPPEDCGGVWGYGDLLEIVSDPDHEKREEVFEWLGEEFDAEHFDKTQIIFSDPQERFEDAFEGCMDTDETDGDMSFDVEDESLGELGLLNAEIMRRIWEKAKEGKIEDLDPEERLLGAIMLEHKKEIFNDSEFSDLTSDRDHDPDTEAESFLHISIHAAVEAQLAGKEPTEALQFYNAMRKKKCSHHQAVHLIGAILMNVIVNSMGSGDAFDIDTYRGLLKKYKSQPPDQIVDLLEEEDIVFH